MKKRKSENQIKCAVDKVIEVGGAQWGIRGVSNIEFTP